MPNAENDALIAILIIKGQEVVIWKARDELYHVVGLRENTDSEKPTQKAEQKSGFQPSIVFQAKP